MQSTKKSIIKKSLNTETKAPLNEEAKAQLNEEAKAQLNEPSNSNSTNNNNNNAPKINETINHEELAWKIIDKFFAEDPNILVKHNLE